MNNIKVGQIFEITDGDTAIVTKVYPTRKTVDLAYTNCKKDGPYMGGPPPSTFLDRPEAEFVDLGKGRLIWNHE